MVSFGFDYALGWLALLSLLPLIILYLIKPKPKEIAVPSLMFFQREERRKRERAFLRRLRRDWLFLAQLLVLLLLGLFFIQPYMIFSKSLLLDNSVIVLDASASMQAGGAFEQAVEKAREVIGKRTTLIMIARAPYVALKDADRKSVTQFLDELSVGAVSSSVGSAMMLALRHLEGEQPDVFVISDFRDTGSVNVVEARQALENAGAVVHLVNVGEDVGKENIGIVDLELSEDEGRVSIKNFKQRGEIVDIIIDGKQKSISLEPGEMENVAVPVSEGVHEITLAVQDDILVDNRAFAVVPSSGKVNVLLLSDDPSPYLLAALSSSDQIILEVYGTIPDEEYDVYVVHKVIGLSQQETSELEKRVRDGAGLVIYAQDDSSTLSYGNLLSLTLGEKKGFGVVEETQQNRFTKGIEFGGVQRRFATEDEEGVTLLRAGNDSLLNLHTLGAGKVVYYGILEGASDFMFNPGYPVLWVKLVSYLGNLMTLADLNREGGSVMTFPEKVLVETPSGTLHASAIVFHEPGLYTVNGQKIAINLLSEEESRLDPAVSLVSGGAYEQGEQGIRQRLDSALVLGALVLLFLELLMTKFRGEI